MEVLLYVGGITLVFMLCARALGRAFDSKDWNGGHCSHCYRQWRYFGIDSQGGHGYTCDGCRKTIWLSWWIP